MRYLCLSRDAEEGKVRLVLGQDGCGYLVSRGKDWRLLVDSNACPHRGFPLLSAENTLTYPLMAPELPIKCRYHGHVFTPRGSVPAFEHLGMCFLGFPNSVEPLTPEQELAITSIGREYQNVQTFVQAEIQLWMRNTMDPNHLDTVHRPGFADCFAPKTRPINVRISGTGNVSSYEMPVLPAAAEQFLLEKTFHPGFFHMTLFPGLSITNYLGILCSVETAVPNLRPAQWGCIVTTRYFLNAGVSFPDRLEEKVLQVLRAKNCDILREDKMVCEEWVKGDCSPKQVAEYNLPGEERISAYVQRWRRGFNGRL